MAYHRACATTISGLSLQTKLDFGVLRTPSHRRHACSRLGPRWTDVRKVFDGFGAGENMGIMGISSISYMLVTILAVGISYVISVVLDWLLHPHLSCAYVQQAVPALVAPIVHYGRKKVQNKYKSDNARFTVKATSAMDVNGVDNKPSAILDTGASLHRTHHMLCRRF